MSGVGGLEKNLKKRSGIIYSSHCLWLWWWWFLPSSDFGLQHDCKEVRVGLTKIQSVQEPAHNLDVGSQEYRQHIVNYCETWRRPQRQWYWGRYELFGIPPVRVTWWLPYEGVALLISKSRTRAHLGKKTTCVDPQTRYCRPETTHLSQWVYCEI